MSILGANKAAIINDQRLPGERNPGEKIFLFVARRHGRDYTAGRKKRTGLGPHPAQAKTADFCGNLPFASWLCQEFWIQGKTYCLLGSSGVGKTTIINRLVGRDAFDTKAVSGTGEGMHTTSRRQLIMLDHGAMLIDTPGMRELGILASDDALEDSFADIHDMAGSCQYSNCSHIQEPGCSVRVAMENGIVSEDRYRNYLKLKKESDYHEQSYVEKRKKDKAFGKFMKTAKKQTKK